MGRKSRGGGKVDGGDDGRPAAILFSSLVDVEVMLETRSCKRGGGDAGMVAGDVRKVEILGKVEEVVEDRRLGVDPLVLSALKGDGDEGLGRSAAGGGGNGGGGCGGWKEVVMFGSGGVGKVKGGALVVEDLAGEAAGSPTVAGSGRFWRMGWPILEDGVAEGCLAGGGEVEAEEGEILGEEELAGGDV